MSTITEFDALAAEMDPDGRAGQLLACIRSGDWLDSQEFPALRWAVPGVMPEGFGLVVGPPKLGKSWMVLGLALAVASGGRAFGRIDVGQPRPTLYLALEDGDRRLQSRCRTLLMGEPIPRLFQYATKVPDGAIVETIRAWLTANVGRDALVILDTLGRVAPPARVGESAYQRDYRIGVALKTITDDYPGSALAVVHHTRKQEGSDWMDSTSGTQGLNGSADWTIALTRSRNEEDAVLKVTGRDVKEGEYAMQASDGAWHLVGSSLAAAAQAAQEVKAKVGLGDRALEILAYVNKHPEGVGPTAVGRALGMEPKHAGTYLTRLADDGRITLRSRGLYTPRVESVESVDSTDSTLSTLTPRCRVCHEPLNFALAAAGERTHPTCEG